MPMFISYRTYAKLKPKHATIQTLANISVTGGRPRYSVYDPIERKVTTYVHKHVEADDEKSLCSLQLGQEFEYREIGPDGTRSYGSFTVENLTEVYDVAHGGHCTLKAFFHWETILSLVKDVENFVTVVDSIAEIKSDVIGDTLFLAFKDRDDTDFRRKVVDDAGVWRVLRNVLRVKYGHINHHTIPPEKFYDDCSKLGNSVLKRLKIIKAAIGGSEVVIDKDFREYLRVTDGSLSDLDKPRFL